MIYDVGLGIAANSVAALNTVHGLSKTRGRLEIYSFERHPEALLELVEKGNLSLQFPWMAAYESALETLVRTGAWKSGCGRTSWTLIPGDFKSLDLRALPQADLVYFDFYAPSVCPELWSYDIFSKLSVKMKADPEDPSLLITYASTKAVRSAMLLAGLSVGDGATTSRKHETTVASPELSALKNPLRSDWLARLARSAKPLPADWPESRREEALERIRRHPQFQK